MRGRLRAKHPDDDSTDRSAVEGSEHPDYAGNLLLLSFTLCVLVVVTVNLMNICMHVIFVRVMSVVPLLSLFGYVLIMK